MVIIKKKRLNLLTSCSVFVFFLLFYTKLHIIALNYDVKMVEDSNVLTTYIIFTFVNLLIVVLCLKKHNFLCYTHAGN